MKATTSRFVLSLLDKPVPVLFRTQEVVVPPGAELPYVREEWRGALVVVERGMIEIESRNGVRRRFRAGDVLFFDGLPVRCLRNRESHPAILSAASRRP